MNRLIDFFINEQRLKWKVYVASSGIAFIYALVRLFAFHGSERSVGFEAVIVLFVLVATFVTVYVAKGEAFFTEAKRPKTVRLGWRLAVTGAVAASLLVSTYVIGISSLQAAIIDFRLESLATLLDTVQAANPTDQKLRARYQKIQSIVGTSSTYQIQVDPSIIEKTQTAVSRSLKGRSPSDQTEQLGWATAIDLQSFAYARKVETGAITPVTPRQIANTGGYLINSPVSLDNANVLYIQGEHSWIALGPGGGQFILNQSNVVFDKIDFLGSVSVSAIELVGDRSSALVRDSIMENVTQNLERITWVDVRFEKSRIHYKEGAPLRLRNVSFKDCDLSQVGGFLGPVNYELEKRIKEAQGEPITFIYEP